MFTGIVEGLGEVRSVRGGPEGGRVLDIAHPFEEGAIAVGDSVAHDGVCLTATAVAPGRFSVDAGPETLARTTIGALQAGRAVNLERSVTLQTRLGGHLVQGHVDAVGEVRSVTARENAWDLWVDVPSDVLQLVIPRGSVAVDGISLTVTGRDARGFSLSIIPHTWKVTALRDRKDGSKVNVEVDLLARYVQGLLEPLDATGGGGLTLERLRELGY
jgi:riboflavin synthase